jgi:hypothetical protein
MLDSSLARDIGYPEVFHTFPQSLQANAGMLSRLGHDRFFLNPIQLINRPIIRRRIVLLLSVVT